MKINPTPVDILHRDDIFCFYKEEQLPKREPVNLYCVTDVDLFDNTLIVAIKRIINPISELYVDTAFFKKATIGRYSLSDVLDCKIYKVEPND
jgi:hypothetical protein